MDIFQEKLDICGDYCQESNHSFQQGRIKNFEFLLVNHVHTQIYQFPQFFCSPTRIQMMVAGRWHHQCASFVNFNSQERVFQRHSGKELLIPRSFYSRQNVWKYLDGNLIFWERIAIDFLNKMKFNNKNFGINFSKESNSW